MILGRKKQAVLPENFEEHTLDAMNTGDVVYTTSWAMWVDHERRCWLHPKYPANLTPGGTAKMKVALREDGYHVWLTDYRYSPTSQPEFVSSADTQYLPVVELHQDNHDRVFPNGDPR